MFSRTVWLAVCGLVLGGSPVRADEPTEATWRADLPAGQFCATTERYYARYGPPENVQRGGCPLDGPCDDPTIRDAYTVGEETPIRVVRTQVIVFCRTNGSDCLTTADDVDAQMVTLNETFAPYRIKFEHETSFARRGTYRIYNDIDERPMKNQYAVEPQRRLNIFVVDTTGFAFGTFPWDDDALTAQGGIVIDVDLFGAGETILTHEVGHCLGLWHTHHGVSEVDRCSACYEVPMDVNGDNTGDRCADTPATPVNFDCDRPGGRDSCSDLRWRQTDYENYMGYAPSFCYTRLSPQQAARCHCWLDDVLWSWLVPYCPEDINADRAVDIADLARLLNDFGTAPSGPTDLDGDGVVGLGDLARLLNRFGQECH